MWNKEKDIKYKKLKRIGYTRTQLKEYFSDDIYDSEYFQKSEKLSFLENYNTFNINEIKISPEETEYTLKKEKSVYYKNQYDIVINFNLKNNKYILILFYIFKNNFESYDLLFTTKEQYDEYKKEMNIILSSTGEHFTDDEQEILKNIVEKETKFDEIIPLMKSLSFILFDVYKDYNFINTLSISETENPVKIKLYRNIIKDSFKNVKEEKINNMYYYTI